MKVDTKLSLVVFGLVCLPLGAALFLAHDGRYEQLEMFLAVGLLVSILLLRPVVLYLANVIYLRDIKAMNRYCLRVKQGDYTAAWDLPREEDDEHDLVQLKRNLYWMVHAISSREDWLQSRLLETRDSMQKFERLSHVDGLTRIANRRYFEARIRELARLGDVDDRGLYLMMLDCDGFKAINDRYGHQTGDELLVKLGEILRDSTREDVDCPFRYGGDEFGVIFSRSTRDVVLRIGERIRSRFLELGYDGASLSIGIAELRQGGCVEAMVDLGKREADRAVYAAKNSGKDRVIAAWEAETAVLRGCTGCEGAASKLAC